VPAVIAGGPLNTGLRATRSPPSPYSSLKYFNSDSCLIARALNESETDVGAARAEEDEYFAAISLGVCPAKRAEASRVAESFLQMNIAPR
jgi:hypothetical protein